MGKRITCDYLEERILLGGRLKESDRLCWLLLVTFSEVLLETDYKQELTYFQAGIKGNRELSELKCLARLDKLTVSGKQIRKQLLVGLK